MAWDLLVLALELATWFLPLVNPTMRNNIPLFSLPFICSILLGLCTLVVSRECLASQQSLLLQLKDSLQFNHSTKLENWTESFDCCSWKGVACEEGRVTDLDLSFGGIYGGLDNSSILFSLQHLKSLDLTGNDFNSTIPSRISDLANLRILKLGCSGFWGEVPIGISRLRGLVTLELSPPCLGSDGKFEIPNLRKLVQNLSKLQELHLDGANILAPVNGWCEALSSSLPNLQVLSLRNSYVPGPLDESLGELQSLSEVDREGTNLSSPVPQSFAKFSNLTILSLRDCGLKGTFPSGIFQIPTLQHIDLSQNNFTGPVPSFNLSTKLTHIDLSNNSFTGEVPLSLFALPSLEKIDLSDNQISGPILEFNSTYSSLIWLNLSCNNLEGLIPTSIFKLGNLTYLDLSYNKFNGTKPWKMFRVSSLLVSLRLSHNNLKLFPDLKILSPLENLDLSSNQISGEIPNWIGEVWKGSLTFLRISYNKLVGFQEPFFFPDSLKTLDLHFNQLQGNIPVLPITIEYIDLSSNNFTSLPYDNFRNLSRISFFSFSNNSLTGELSEHICAANNVLNLDMSHNNLSGIIPSCLLETSDSREMVNLGKNNFKGPIPDVFPRGCKLKVLGLNGNIIEGEIPKSLANCFELELLDLGRNVLVGKFPCLLKNMSSLRVLILRSNKLYGSIECLNANGSWPMLQIFDLAHNNFSGELPRRWLTKLQGMMANEDDAYSEVLRLDDESGCSNVYARDCSASGYHARVHYVYTVTVTFKGFERELPKILAIFTCIDLSRNNFHGPIPEEFGQLHALYILDLSHNALAGQIPSYIGNLRHLESLDLSWNNLGGRIPTQLQSLTFLEFLNLSYNHLVGMIPTGTQLQTFSADSYLGNRGLCGFPLPKNCSDKATRTFPSAATKDNQSDSGREINWNLLSAEIGLLTGFAIVISPLVFSHRWRARYYERVDDIIINIFPLAMSRKWFQWTAP